MNQKRQHHQITLPVQIIKKKIPEAQEALENKSGMPQKGIIPFALLSRKGAKQKIEKIELPSDNSIVIKTRQRIQEEQKERDEVKESTM